MPALSGQHGAMLLAGNTTRFALWAPDASRVAVRLADGSLHELPSQAAGWFRGDVDCPAGTTYRFLIDQRLEVPDPASRHQPEGVHGPSRVVDQQAYTWRTTDWNGRPWHESILYELHVGALGGFKAVEAYLPRLVELGVSAVELMPLNQCPGTRNWGYDGVLPFAPQSSYGTPDELKSLIDRAHALGLMVFVDVVYNHFGPDGNYLGQYASGFFRQDLPTPWGPAIDFRRQQVRDFFCENALMWVLDYRVDGLRLDAVHAISEKDFLLELAQRVHAAVPAQRHVHLVLENEDNGAGLLTRGFVAQWNDDGHNALHNLLTGERDSYYADFADDPTAKLARCLGEGFVYQGEANRHGRNRGEPSDHLPATAFVLFLQNHDQIGNRAFGERLIQLTDQRALKAALGLLLLSPMVPLLFMGEEWGSRQPFLFFTDHHEQLGLAVREGRRNEFSEFPAFADAGLRQAIPDPNAPGTFTRSIPDQQVRDMPEHRQWLRFYQQLLALRREWLLPRLGDARSAGVEVLGDKALRAAWRLDDGSQLRIDLNLSATPAAVRPCGEAAELIFACGLDISDYRQGVLAPFSVITSMDRPT